MRKNMTKALSMICAQAVIISLLSGIPTQYAYAAKNDEKHVEKTSDTPEIDVQYETGTQINAKNRRDDAEAIRTEDDGSYDVVVLDESEEVEGEEDIEWEDIHISTPEQFYEFAKNCSLDTWSQNKNVYLDNDIIITSIQIKSVPTFGGHFYGGGHEINGYTMNEPRSYTGLFAYTQETAVIEGLLVKGTVKTDGKQMVTGGIVGENHGEIRNCTFEGVISGQNYVGGIAGYNELTGSIVNCKSKGEISGAYYTGGITGENVGNISSCVNEAEVNTKNVDRVTSFQDIDLSSYADGLISKLTGQAAEKTTRESLVDTGSVDAGGIAGISIGVIQFCDNKGEVGYEHVGYNIGGIAGRQSGYIHGCTNSATVRGRKDVGGIVGQAEPYVVVDFTEDTITKLSDNINKLHDIIDGTLSDADVSSDTISDRLSIVKQFADRAITETSFLSDQTITWTNGMVGSGNELMSRAQYIINETSREYGPIDESTRALDDVKAASEELVKTITDLDAFSYMTPEQRSEYENAKRKSEFLTKKSEENNKKYSKAAENYYIQKELESDVPHSKYSDTTHELKQYGSDGNELPSQILSSNKNLDDWTKVDTWKHVDGTVIGTNTTDYPDDTTIVENATKAFNDATALSGGPTKSSVRVKADEETSNAYYAEFGESITSPDAELANQAIIIAKIAEDVEPLVKNAAKNDADLTTDSMKRATEHLKEAGNRTRSIISDLAGKGQITMPTLSEEYRTSTANLNAALQAMSDNMGALNNEMNSSSDVMIGDMGDVNDQFNVIMQLYADAIDGVLDEDYGDNIEDNSMEVAETCMDATIADCENSGKIEGDLDVSGIAGAMGIEYDFDLESDLTKSDDATFNQTYQSKCVLRKNRNNAHVIAQKSYAGGICGLQEIGTVLACENYGKIKSNSSDYVGGIAGDSLSYIQKSVAKCFLYGKNYVGGIAGHGCNILNSYAMVQIDENQADSFYGAIAGEITDEGKVHYNYFIGDDLAGIDRISYKGQAEPISYETFISIESTPKECSKIYAAFYIDDVEVDRIETTYGGTIQKSQFPIFVGEDGTYCRWDKDDLVDMQFDSEVEGEYIRYITTLASDQMRKNNLSAVLVDGRFKEGDTITCTSGSIADVPVSNVIERWSVDIPSEASESHLIRYKDPDVEKIQTEIYINNAGRWDKVDTETFGLYKTFEICGGHVEFAVVQLTKNWLDKKMIFAISGAAALIVIIVIIVLVKKKRKIKR